MLTPNRHQMTYQVIPQQRGLSLVELMISITLSLVIMSGVIQLFYASTQNATTVQGASRIQENIRYAFKRIGDDIAQAGNFGCLNFTSGSKVNNADFGNYINNNLTGVNVNADIWNNFEQSFVSGADENAVDGDGIRNTTDTLIVKYVDNNSAMEITGSNGDAGLNIDDATSFSVGDVVFAGDCESLYIFALGAVDIIGDHSIDMANVPAEHKLKSGRSNSIPYLYSGNSGSYTYHIDTGAAGGDCEANVTSCSLYRTFNGDTPQELVLGVSDLDIQYGREDGNSLDYSSTFNVANAALIDRVRISMVFNAVDPAQNNDVQTKTVTRVFAIRNQFEE